jgi:hypothetical protein
VERLIFNFIPSKNKGNTENSRFAAFAFRGQALPLGEQGWYDSRGMNWGEGIKNDKL